jgi:hypothetical protein
MPRLWRSSEDMRVGEVRRLRRGGWVFVRRGELREEWRGYFVRGWYFLVPFCGMREEDEDGGGCVS